MMMGRSAIVGAIAFLMIGQMGLVVGLNTGVDADTWAGASASFDGETFRVGDDASEIDYPEDGREVEPRPTAQFIYEHTPLDRPEPDRDGAVNRAIERVVSGILFVAFHLAAVTAHVGAKVGYLLPAKAYTVPALATALEGLALVTGLGGFVVYAKPLLEYI